jgi:hypothetical protein
MYTNYVNCRVADGPVLIATLGSRRQTGIWVSVCRDAHYCATSPNVSCLCHPSVQTYQSLTDKYCVENFGQLRSFTDTKREKKRFNCHFFCEEQKGVFYSNLHNYSSKIGSWLANGGYRGKRGVSTSVVNICCSCGIVPSQPFHGDQDQQYADTCSSNIPFQNHGL